MYTALILCGGNSTRSRLDYNKVFYEVNGKPIIQYAIERFQNDVDCEAIVIVAKEVDFSEMRALSKNIELVLGGKRRQDSARLGLKHVHSDYVLIHDGSRPYFSEESLARLKAKLKEVKSVSLGMPIIDTVKRVNQDIVIGDILREGLMSIQTPQGFLTKTIQEAHNIDDGKDYTCDASLLKARLNIETYIVKGDRMNIKFTTPEDRPLMEMILS